VGRIIPNQNTYIAFSHLEPTGSMQAPKVADYTSSNVKGNAFDAKQPVFTADGWGTVWDLTCLTMSINASAQGNTVPTPSICSLFETSVPGTSQATFQADFYRDDDWDLAWHVMPRGQKGYFYISRFGGTGPRKAPVAGEHLEVWPVTITSRTAGALSSNTAQTFQITCAVNIEPAEDAVAVA
jgi:hypothetical protein